MPVDTSKGFALNASRRQFRKVSTEEELELKRARGEISCAECRRFYLSSCSLLTLIVSLQTQAQMR